MIPRNFINFFKTKTGKIITFGALFAGGMVVFNTLSRHHASAEDATPSASSAASTNSQPQVVQSVVRPLQTFNPPPPKPVTAIIYTPPSAGTGMNSTSYSNGVSRSLPVVLSQRPEPLAPIGLFADSAAGISTPKKLSVCFAPFGRLIPCETVITVDSSSMQTPIVGLVTENVYFGGKLVIPAGTEVHGTAQTDHQRERIASGSSWILVWQKGEEMQIKAIALDREFDNNTNQSGWSVTDGSAGLRGETIKSDNFADIKLFAATFLSGAANALTEKQQTIFGPVNSPTLNNAPFAGAQAVLETYAQRIYDAIQKDGFYIRVPSGKQFYLYVLQTIDRADASLGGIGITDEPQTATKSTP
jgi:hypothetical protein